MKSYPFDSFVVGNDEQGNEILDRPYAAEDIRMHIGKLFTSGVGMNPSNNMQVESNQGMTVIVNPGFGNILGCVFVEENQRVLQFTASDTLDRIDRVVCRFNNADVARNVDLYILKGNPASIPTAPTPTVTDEYYELVLATVFIPKNSTAISASRITDERMDTAVCGHMSAVGEVDTTSIFNQYQAALDEYLDIVNAALDETLAGNLQRQINTHTSQIEGIVLDFNDEINAIATTISELESDVAERLKPYTIWENPSPKSALSAKNINISDLNTYKYFKCYFNSTQSGNVQMFETLPGGTTKAVSYQNLTNSSAIQFLSRNIEYTSNQIRLEDCLSKSGTSGSPVTANVNMIPIKIIGYK